ncbi:MAG: tetratricopeptide repeat protein [Chitinophagaceae bacterium]|nr:tetratricopeptide repeat protein [Chitinophagaceae bacterium]
MSKQKNKPVQRVAPTAPVQQVVQETTDMQTPDSSWHAKLLAGYIPYVLLMLFSILLYANTFKHQFALDDDIVICKNEYVLQGIQGMPNIFSKDLFDSFYKQMNTTAQLSGGRYRPLSVASFAIEQEFIGTRDNAAYEANCWDENKNGKQDVSEDLSGDGLYNDRDCRVKGFTLRHVNNVLFYGLAICVLFLFLSRVVFKNNKLLAFIISLLFLAHPIHTEVVANVKSRDEIFSFAFMLLTLFYAHRYEATKTMKYLVITGISFLAAMLSKEYGATLLILVPLSLYLFSEKKLEFKNLVPVGLTLFGVFLVYFMMRQQAGIVMGKSDLQDTELLNNPYLLANESQQLATKLYIFLKYLMTQIFPHPLSSDYGFNSIPYRDFSNPEVWLSILLLIGMVAGGFYAFRKRNWMAFAVGFYLFNILLVTNLIFNVGATMGERLVFHSSLGYCMVLGFGLYWLAEKMKQKQVALFLVLPILVLYSMKTISRNKAWQSDITLALTDVEIMPESTSLNGNAASRYLDLSDQPRNKSREKELIAKSVVYGRKAIQLHPGFVNGYMNLGLAYAKTEQYDSAKKCWDIAFKIYPHHPNKPIYYNLLGGSYYAKGFNLGSKQQWKEGQYWLLKAVEMSPDNAKYWYDLGGFSYNAGDYAKAKEAWSKAYQLDPKNPDIQKVQGVLP